MTNKNKRKRSLAERIDKLETVIAEEDTVPKKEIHTEVNKTIEEDPDEFEESNEIHLKDVRCAEKLTYRTWRCEAHKRER